MDELTNFYKDLLDNIHDGIYFIDRKRRITYWNKGAERISGFDADKVIGKRCMDNILVHIDGNGALLCNTRCPIVATMEQKTQMEAEVFLHHKDGHRVPVLVHTAPMMDDNGIVIGAVESFSDNSKMVLERKKTESLSAEVTRDPLTGISNRQYFRIKMDGFLSEFSEFHSGFGLLFIDIDHFKAVNDRFGHASGDEVLKMVAKTLDQNLRTTDNMSRWGGEEFIGLIHNVDRQRLSIIAEKLRVLVERSQLILGDDRLSVTVSIGGTIVREADTAEIMLKRADQLMYKCKTNGRNRILVSD